MSDTDCRCGHPKASEAAHPCHNHGYGCRKPAKQRFYNPSYPALAGMQMKVQVMETWACDECWAAFSDTLRRLTGTK